eukprot:4002103-Alexandrium_andersonii.AAC.1
MCIRDRPTEAEAASPDTASAAKDSPPAAAAGPPAAPGPATPLRAEAAPFYPAGLSTREMCRVWSLNVNSWQRYADQILDLAEAHEIAALMIQETH